MENYYNNHFMHACFNALICIKMKSNMNCDPYLCYINITFTLFRCFTFNEVSFLNLNLLSFFLYSDILYHGVLIILKFKIKVKIQKRKKGLTNKIYDVIILRFKNIVPKSEYACLLSLLQFLLYLLAFVFFYIEN